MIAVNIRSSVSTKVQRGLPSPIQGLGIFASQTIHKGEMIAVKGGSILDEGELHKTGIAGHAELQIGDKEYIAPRTMEELHDSMIYINHSCNPNVGMGDEKTFIAMRDITPGEELTIDYAMIDAAEYEMRCSCGSNRCRRLITGKDWMKQELQERYWDYFAPYLKKKIK